MTFRTGSAAKAAYARAEGPPQVRWTQVPVSVVAAEAIVAIRSLGGDT
jgi:hypothetical protein